MGAPLRWLSPPEEKARHDILLGNPQALQALLNRALKKANSTARLSLQKHPQGNRLLVIAGVRRGQLPPPIWVAKVVSEGIEHLGLAHTLPRNGYGWLVVTGWDAQKRKRAWVRRYVFEEGWCVEMIPKSYPAEAGGHHSEVWSARLVFWLVLLFLISLLSLVGGIWAFKKQRAAQRRALAPVAAAATLPAKALAVAPRTPPPPTPTPDWSPMDRWGAPWSDTVPGVLTFRGNPTRTYYGEGPVPRKEPKIAWKFPKKPMCMLSTDQNNTREWCGLGWTGQPVVFERQGQTWLVVGGYDGHLHFLDADTGERIREDFVTGDLVKGTPTIDPDGYPLVYFGSRDDQLRVVAFDRDPPQELWKLWAHDVAPTLWNNDWDASPLILRGHLLETGENSQWHIVRLNREWDLTGRVQVHPELVFHAPGWDATQLHELGDEEVSIENSIMVWGHTAWFSNSGGLVQGWDLSPLDIGGAPKRVSRFWAGEDMDATLVPLPDGTLLGAQESERKNAQSQKIGQIFRLGGDGAGGFRTIWSLHEEAKKQKSGVWATPAVWHSVAFFGTHLGHLLAVDTQSGNTLWDDRRKEKIWSSPIVVEDVLISADCSGRLEARDLKGWDPQKGAPPLLWDTQLPGCLEATPVVWKGKLFIGSRDGHLYALEDKNSKKTAHNN